MKYTVYKIEEDIDFGCEEHDDHMPVMAVVTLLDENGIMKKIRHPDGLLYDRDINEGDCVRLTEEKELIKDEDHGK